MNVNALLRRVAPAISTACVAAALLAPAVGHAAVVYSNNFEGGSPVALGGAGSNVGSAGYSAFGFGSRLWHNDSAGDPAAASTITLAGLQAHSTISLSFLLAVIDSWDGFAGNGCAPDNFNVRLDGATVFATDFGNVRDGSCGSHAQTYPFTNALFFPTAANIDNTGTSTDVGFSPRWNDSAYDMGLEASLQNIAHSSSTATIEFFASGAGWQGGGDESFGLDNIRVSTNAVISAVPEPGTLALAALALAGAAVVRRRR